MSERGEAQTSRRNSAGVVGLLMGFPGESYNDNGRSMERATKEGDSPVREIVVLLRAIPEYCGTREIPWESGRTIFQG